jgi:hypothetical protein
MIKRYNCCIGEFNRELEKFIDKYNTYGPHQSLDFLTPMEHIERRMINEGDFFPKVVDEDTTKNNLAYFTLKVIISQADIAFKVI